MVRSVKGANLLANHFRRGYPCLASVLPGSIQVMEVALGCLLHPVIRLNETRLSGAQPVKTHRCLRCSSRFSWLSRSAFRSSHVFASAVGRSLTPRGFPRMGSGGSSSFDGLAVEDACLG